MHKKFKINDDLKINYYRKILDIEFNTNKKYNIGYLKFNNEVDLM